MSKRRKKARGNPAAEPEAEAARPEIKDGFLTDANQRAATGEYSSPRILVYALVFVAAFMFFYLHLYAMPQLRHFADGLSMPGARVFGYSVEDIEQLRAVMEDSAAGQLNFLHITAGWIFPVTVVLATWAVMGLLVKGSWRWIFPSLAGGFAAVDIIENHLVDQILTMETLDAGTVTLASTFTVISWALLAVIAAGVLAVVGWDVIGRLRARAAASRR
ncbi:hypothetical protein [Nesterenkonia alba]|uniref:hypothetical protein n=1 Tax=Nesterenkonia alba TaxID=515814 RepID=UPI0003B4ADAE|nr:hypothetical protein [Nesterenkonia alba]